MINPSGKEPRGHGAVGLWNTPSAAWALKPSPASPLFSLASLLEPQDPLHPLDMLRTLCVSAHAELGVLEGSSCLPHLVSPHHSCVSPVWLQGWGTFLLAFLSLSIPVRGPFLVPGSFSLTVVLFLSLLPPHPHLSPSLVLILSLR